MANQQTNTSNGNRAELKPVLYPNGMQRKADAGATDQGGRHAMKECSACGRFVVFVQSTKTSKWYLADCFRYQGHDAYYYVKASPHFKTCERMQKEAASTVAYEQLRSLNSTKTAEMLASMDELKTLNLADDQWEPEFNARFDAIQQKYADEIARLQAIIDERNK
jgi:hypothetical protein